MSKKCYIVGAGDNSGTIFTRKKEDLVIAADGGVKALERLGIVPDLVMGDFDSLGYIPAGNNVIVHPVEKDETDMMLAISKAMEMGFYKIIIYGGTGGRIDHTIANLQTMLDTSRKGVSITMIDGKNEYYMLTNGTLSISGNVGQGFSVFAFGSQAKGVTINGGKYEAQNVILQPNNPLAVSNSFVDSLVEISVSDGSLLVIKEKN